MTESKCMVANFLFMKEHEIRQKRHEVVDVPVNKDVDDTRSSFTLFIELTQY